MILPSARILCAASLAEADLWTEILKSPTSFSSNLSNSLGIPVSNEVESGKEVSIVMSRTFSSLLAHPSLALRFVGLPYHQLPPRLILLTVQGFKPISCNVDRERDLFVALESENGGKQNAVYHNEVKNGFKTISITSPLCVENQTDDELFVFFSSLGGSCPWEPLKKNDQHFCPLSFVNDAILHVALSPDLSLYGSISLRNLSKGRVQSSLNIGTLQNPYFVRLVLHRSSLYDDLKHRFVDTYRLCLVPILSFINMLPLPIECLVVNGNSVLQKNSLSAGEKFLFHASDVNPTLRREEQSIHIRIRPQGSKMFSLFDESILPNLRPSTQSCWVYDAEYLPLRLSYNVVLSEEGIVTVQLFSDFWIVNRTNEELILTEKKDEISSYRTIPALSSSIIDSSAFHSRIESNSITVIPPCLFACAQSDPSSSIFIRTKTSEWSEKLGIGAVGTTGITALNPDKGSHQSTLRVFGVSISSAPSIFGMSKIVTISACMILLKRFLS